MSPESKPPETVVEFARRIVTDPEYLESLLARLAAGTAPPSVELALLKYLNVMTAETLSCMSTEDLNALEKAAAQAKQAVSRAHAEGAAVELTVAEVSLAGWPPVLIQALDDAGAIRMLELLNGTQIWFRAVSLIDGDHVSEFAHLEDVTFTRPSDAIVSPYVGLDVRVSAIAWVCDLVRID